MMFEKPPSVASKGGLVQAIGWIALVDVDRTACEDGRGALNGTTSDGAMQFISRSTRPMLRGRKRQEQAVCWRRRQARHAISMDDEISRKGIKEELTTRDEYLATRFTKLSVSQHDLTPFTPAETREAASHLSPETKAVLFGAADGVDGNGTELHGTWRDHRDKGLYACAVGGLPLFTSGWKLEPRVDDDCPSFAEPCDEEHVIEEADAESGVVFVSCARSGLRVGRVVPDSDSPSGKRYLISSAALEFHPLGKALPVRCQPENYWGSEGQYRAWVLS